MRYSRRLFSTEIRLLVILPAASPTQPLKCQLQNVTLDAAPSYEALSYVWGDPTARAEFDCDGACFSSTSSLHQALLQIRSPDAVRVVWADAICINQEDLSERAHQVTLMGRIYTQAERVIVWLGREFEERASTAQAALKSVFTACMAHEKWWEETPKDEASLQPLLARYTEFERNRLTRSVAFTDGTSVYKGSSVGWNFYRCVSPPTELDQAAWDALKLLYDLAWFRRIWCIQEIRLSRSAVCYWGDQKLAWSWIGITAAWLEDCHSRHDYAPGTFPAEINYSTAINMYDTEWTTEPLLDTLNHYRDSLATDPRDKVYGILNLVEEGPLRESIVIDYQKPVEKVYAETAVQIMHSQSSLNVLAYVEHNEYYTGDDHFPSWALRWDLEDRTMPLLRFDSIHADKISTLGSHQLDSDDMRLEGWLYAKVSSIDVLLDDVLMKNRVAVGTTDPFLDMWNRVMRPDTDSFDPIPTMFDMAQTLTGGDVFLSLSSTSEDRLQLYADYLSMISHLFRVTGQMNLTPYDPMSLTGEDGERSRFETIMWQTCDQRRIIWLENGSYGLGPACIREGDLVVLLAGGQTPYAVRAKGRGYTFLGAVYIQQVVTDELIHTIRDGSHELQDYLLV